MILDYYNFDINPFVLCIAIGMKTHLILFKMINGDYQIMKIMNGLISLRVKNMLCSGGNLSVGYMNIEVCFIMLINENIFLHENLKRRE